MRKRRITAALVGLFAFVHAVYYVDIVLLLMALFIWAMLWCDILLFDWPSKAKVIEPPLIPPLTRYQQTLLNIKKLEDELFPEGLAGGPYLDPEDLDFVQSTDALPRRTTSATNYASRPTPKNTDYQCSLCDGRRSSRYDNPLKH